MQKKIYILIVFVFGSLLILSNTEPQNEIDQKILTQTQKFKLILETAQKNTLDSFDI